MELKRWHNSKAGVSASITLAAGVIAVACGADAVNLVPAAALLVTSLTPFSLTNPEATFTFSNPLVNYQQLLHDDRFLNSLVTQLKLSVVSVFFQC